MLLKMNEEKNLTATSILKQIQLNKNQLAVLVDPEDFKEQVSLFIHRIPKETTLLLVGGSSVEAGKTQQLVSDLKSITSLPVVLFPGDYTQLCPDADAVLFLSLLSGQNPEYLINQQVKAVEFLKSFSLEIIPTAYILIDGGCETAVVHISKTRPISSKNINQIVNTALAGQYMGKQLIYLEAGSGAIHPVPIDVISAVKDAIQLPLIVGGGIKTEVQKQAAYLAGADVVVMGTAFEI